jgi:hypothetical protein
VDWRGATSRRDSTPRAPNQKDSLSREARKGVGSRSVSRVLWSDRSSLCGHSSWSTIARALQQPTRSVLVEVGASRCLFGLAPAGVSPATTVTSRAVSSYLTISPLPDPRIVGGVFSVALSVAPLAQRAQALPGSLPMEPGLSSTRQARRDRSTGNPLLDANNATFALRSQYSDAGARVQRAPVEWTMTD